jgi:putative MFS transporter
VEEVAKKKFILNERQKMLLPVVMLGALFEGYDFMVVNLVLPYVARDFGINEQIAAYALSIIAIGTLVAFFVVRMADKIGRRPIFLFSVLLYSLFTLLTAFSPRIEIFVTLQFLGRIFLIGCWAVGYIIMSEEFDPELRGRALALFQAAAAIGAILPSIVLPFAAHTELHWRLLYILGGIPLLVLFWGWNKLPETRRFEALKLGKEKKEEAPRLFAVFEKPYLKYTLAIMALWFFMYLCYTSSMNFFAYRVVRELSWSESQVGLITAVGYTLGLLGYYVTGKMLDRFGRKKTAYAIFTLGALAVMGAFQMREFLLVGILMIVAVFFVGSFTVICATFTNEVFPTAIRANAMAWGNNIVGRIGQIAAPALVGLLVPIIGLGNAVTALAIAPFICIAIVALLLPETLGYRVEKD